MKTALVIVSSYTLATDYRTTLGIARESTALRACVAIARAWRTQEGEQGDTLHIDSGRQCVEVRRDDVDVFTVSYERAEFLKP